MWHSEGSPPFGQDSTWSMEKEEPQAQSDGALRGIQPYSVKQVLALRKADLCKANPCSCMGKAVNQLEAPFTEAKSTAHCKDWSKSSCKAKDREENSLAFDL